MNETATAGKRTPRVIRTPTVSAGVVVVRRDQDEWKFLLLRAFTHWDFPKGLIEPNEDARLAATREAREEANLSDLHFRWGDDVVDTGPYRANKIARYFLAETATVEIVLPANPDIGRPEHHEGRWVTLAEARELVSRRLVPVLEWAEAKLKQGSSASSPTSSRTSG